MNQSSDKFRLSFSIGPVQSFVGQARRTRDLWTGSWLLSFLAETALVEAEKRGGVAIIPHRSGEEKVRISSTRSAIGSIPNRFEVAFDNEESASEAGSYAAKAFKDRWNSIANFVWTNYVASINSLGNRTETIWKRQVDNFWEVNWVVSSSPSVPSRLAGLELSRRKQFRNVPATEEPGTKCSLMKEFQEISGHLGEEQREFWRAFREKSADSSIDLKKDERLCAVGIIKRFFPEIVDEFVSSELKDQPHHSIKDQSRWPSLAFFAALPWLKLVEGNAQALAGAAKLAGEAMQPETSEKYESAGYWESELIPQKDFGLGTWAGVDASVWHRSGLANNLVGFSPAKQRELESSQKKLYDSMKPRCPIPYYALLLADGDSMGKLLAKLNDPSELSRLLNEFSGKVQNIISQSIGNGRVVYAGGDDVFALLAAKDALDAANKLQLAYKETFRNSVANDEATLSVAIVYAHFKYPFTSAIRTGHELLNEIAKDRTGRDSLALGLIQPNGLSAVWSNPWKAAFPQVQDAKSFRDLVSHFSSVNQKNAEFNTSFLQTLRTQFRRLLPISKERPGQFQATELGEDVLSQLANSEYRRRMTRKDRSNQSPDDTKKIVDDLMSLSYPRIRNAKGELESDPSQFSYDGWKLARFLKQVEDGEIVDHE